MNEATQQAIERLNAALSTWTQAQASVSSAMAEVGRASTAWVAAFATPEVRAALAVIAKRVEEFEHPPSAGQTS